MVKWLQSDRGQTDIPLTIWWSVNIYLTFCWNPAWISFHWVASRRDVFCWWPDVGQHIMTSWDGVALTFTATSSAVDFYQPKLILIIPIILGCVCWTDCQTQHCEYITQCHTFTCWKHSMSYIYLLTTLIIIHLPVHNIQCHRFPSWQHTQCHTFLYWQHSMSYISLLTTLNVIHLPGDNIQCHRFPSWQHTQCHTFTCWQHSMS